MPIYLSLSERKIGMANKATSSTSTLVLLDRDGVVCGNPAGGVRTYGEFKMVPGLQGAFRRLAKGNLWIGIITNQPGISRGIVSKSDLAKMNHDLVKTATAAGIVRGRFVIKVCPHIKEDGCRCRKPRAGLILNVMRQFKLDPATTRLYLVGDKLTDLQTLDNYYLQELKPLGVPRSRARTILLDWKFADPSKERRLMTEGGAKVLPNLKMKSLESAATKIMKLEKGR